MSIKNFLETKEMQTGGMLSFNSLDTGASFVSPFAKPESPRSKFPSPVERAPLPIPKKETPPTIKLEDPIDMDPGSFDPSNSGTLSMHHPSVIAGAEALNYTLTGAESQETLMDIVANAPGNKFTDFLDAAGLFVGKAALVGATGGLGAPVVGAIDRMTTGSVFGTAKGLGSKALEAAEYVLGNINQTTSAQSTVPTAAPAAPAGAAFGIEDFAPEVPAAPVATTPDSARQAIAAINRTPAPAAPAAATAAAVGTGMFGVAFGMGGEVSPNFAIGGSGSYTSFGHYGAGISQADEITIGQTGLASGAFASAESGKTAIDAMVANGYNEAQITEAAKSTEDLQGQDFMNYQGADGGGGGDKVICQELYDQDLLEHSIYSLDEQFGEYLRKHDLALLEGYHTWAYSVVNAMRKSKTITHIVRIVSRPVVKHIAYKMGYPSKTLLGAVMFNVGAFVCRRLAKKETVYA